MDESRGFLLKDSVNIFINHFWNNSKKITKKNITKNIFNIPKERTWLSCRLRQVAAREAVDMIKSVKEVFEWNKKTNRNKH